MCSGLPGNHLGFKASNLVKQSTVQASFKMQDTVSCCFGWNDFLCSQNNTLECQICLQYYSAPYQGVWQAVARSPWFDRVSLFVITFNAVARAANLMRLQKGVNTGVVKAQNNDSWTAQQIFRFCSRFPILTLRVCFHQT